MTWGSRHGTRVLTHPQFTNFWHKKITNVVFKHRQETAEKGGWKEDVTRCQMPQRDFPLACWIFLRPLPTWRSQHILWIKKTNKPRLIQLWIYLYIQLYLRAAAPAADPGKKKRLLRCWFFCKTVMCIEVTESVTLWAPDFYGVLWGFYC